MFGEKVRRIEDPALLRGKGRYLDDIHRPDMLHAAFVRSPFAHARINGIDASAALAAEGVVAVYAAADLKTLLPDIVLPVEQPSGALRHSANPSALAEGVVRYVGEPVACVIADHPYRAEDAAALVEVDYDPLPVSADYLAALKDGAPRAHEAFDDNVVAAFTLAYGAVDDAFAKAPHVFRETLHQHKGLGHAMECRGVAAELDSRDGVLNVWSATQMAHRA
ncbi:MAG: molybdopterin cofactor-binding domain-containing protein, partial [Rhodospirillaceae bacterium]